MSTTVLKTPGLVTNPNIVGSAGEGALAIAQNVVIRSRDVIEPRRGFKTESNTFGASSSYYSTTGTFYGGGKVVHTALNTLAYATSGAYTSYSGTFTPPDNALLRMKFAEQNGNLYATTSAGVKMLPSLTGTWDDAGVPRALDAVAALSGNPSASGSWMPEDTQVAYRIVLGELENGKPKLGAPSGRVVVANPDDVTVAAGALARVGNTVTATVPAGHSYRVDDVVSVTITAADAANFSSGNKTINGVTSTTFTYTEVAADATSTEPQVFSSGTKKTSLQFQLPSDVTTSKFYRVYRSALSSAADVGPGDELYLVYEAYITAAQISAGQVIHTDSTPDSALFSDPAYWNPRTGDGILQSNFQPPIAKDIAHWNDRMWFANTTSKHRYTIQVLGTGTPDGIQSGDTITIGGVTYSAVAAGIGVVSPQFEVYENFDAGTNIAQTAASLAYNINRWGPALGSTVRAYVVSGETDAPGKILIEEEAIGGSAFYVSTSRPAAFNPVVPTTFEVTEASSSRTGSTVTITTAASHGFTTGDVVRLSSNSADADFPVGNKTITVTGATTFTYSESGAADTMTGVYRVSKITAASDNDVLPHGLYYSKVDQPEAVPLVNVLRIGARNQQILRIVPLREKLFVFKENGGIYVVSGDAPYLRVDQLDDKTHLFGADTAVVLNNLIFAFSNQGVVAISEAGVQILSYNIEDQLRLYLNPAVSRVGIWGCAYDTDRTYIMYIGAEDELPGVAYVYNYLSKAWTKWAFETTTTWAGVNPADDRMYFGSDTTNALYKERKAHTRADYVDSELSVELLAASAVGTTATLTVASTTGIAVGDLLTQGEFGGIVSEVTSATVFKVFNATAATVDGIVADPATVHKAIESIVEYQPLGPKGPGALKSFRETTYHFDRLNAYLPKKTSRTERNSTQAVTPLTDSTYDVFADYTAWPTNRRTNVPTSMNKGAMFWPGMTIREARADWALNGLTLEANVESEISTN